MTKRGLGHACGKVILFGEHAVVHGTAAIAAGIDRGAGAEVNEAARDSLSINGESMPADAPLRTALADVQRELAVGSSDVRLSLALPAGAGLGASAAMGVATIRALCDLHQIDASVRRVLAVAQVWERVFHGNPSGVDVAAAQYGRPIRFSRSSEPDALLMKRPLALVVAQAGPPASTKTMVAGVARLKDRNPKQFDRTLEAIGALVENAHLLLRSGDLAAVGKLMDLNHMLLAGWMLSTSELETACHLAREAGALGAKLTGAGGGGCVIALCGEAGTQEASERTTQVMQAYGSSGISSFTTVIQAEESPR